MRVRQVGHFLPAVTEPETLDSAAAPRDQGLHLLQPGVQLVFSGSRKARSRPMRSGMCVARKRIAPMPPNESMPRSARFVPAINMTTKVVAPIRTVVPRSTSVMMRRDQQTDDRERNDETVPDLARFVSHNPKTRRRGRRRPQFGKLGGLTGDAVKPSQRQEPLIL